MIRALSGATAHVPYRNSRLTYLLQDALAPGAKVLMITNVSPTAESLEETSQSCSFAQRCKEVSLGRATKQFSYLDDLVNIHTIATDAGLQAIRTRIIRLEQRLEQANAAITAQPSDASAESARSNAAVELTEPTAREPEFPESRGGAVAAGGRASNPGRDASARTRK